MYFLHSLSVENASLKREREQLCNERNDLFGLAERRQAELERGQQEWKRLSQQLVEANNAKCEALIKVRERLICGHYPVDGSLGTVGQVLSR